MKNQISYQNTLDIDLLDVFQNQRSYAVNLAIQRFKLSRCAAKELFTDAILILNENVAKGKLTHTEYLRAYVFGIMRNLWCKQQKADIKQQRFIEATKQIAPTRYEQHTDSDLTFELNTILEKLNDRHRQILELYYVHKLSLADIAEDLGYRSAAVVKNLKFRALQNCREVIGERVCA